MNVKYVLRYLDVDKIILCVASVVLFLCWFLLDVRGSYVMMVKCIYVKLLQTQVAPALAMMMEVMMMTTRRVRTSMSGSRLRK